MFTNLSESSDTLKGVPGLKRPFPEDSPRSIRTRKQKLVSEYVKTTLWMLMRPQKDKIQYFVREMLSLDTQTMCWPIKIHI